MTTGHVPPSGYPHDEATIRELRNNPEFAAEIPPSRIGG